MAWARQRAGTSLSLPPPLEPEPHWTPAALCGRPCLYAASAEAGLRAGVVIDVRLATLAKPDSAVCAHIALTGRATALWVSLDQPPGG
eukprot:1135301-Prymnesium_polylepis.1